MVSKICTTHTTSLALPQPPKLSSNIKTRPLPQQGSTLQARAVVKKTPAEIEQLLQRLTTVTKSAPVKKAPLPQKIKKTPAEINQIYTRLIQPKQSATIPTKQSPQAMKKTTAEIATIVTRLAAPKICPKQPSIPRFKKRRPSNGRMPQFVKRLANISPSLPNPYLEKIALSPFTFYGTGTSPSPKNPYLQEKDSNKTLPINLKNAFMRT